MKTRLWCFTNFDLEFDYNEYMKNTTATYLYFGTEVCPKTKKQHHQGYVYFSGARGSMKQVAKQLGCCHVEPCAGNIDQNTDYCSKDGEITEFGKRPKQGQRIDLEDVKDDIMKGKSVDDICVENPSVYHQYGRTLNKLEDIALRKKYRTEMTSCKWIWGPTGTGKSHMAFDGFNPETHFVYPYDKDWWDGYKGQPIVIFNEFRGAEHISFGRLLNLIDKYPIVVSRRGREPVPFLAKEIIITSSLHPSVAYQDLSMYGKNEDIKQLYRRIQMVHLEQKWSEGNTEPQT